MKIMYKGIKVVVMLTLALAFSGCEDDDAVLPRITAEFTQTINQDNGVVTFINVSENADSFMWDFGDGTTSTEVNPTKIYETGTYTVILTAENVAGASDEFEDEINIQIPEEVSFPITFDDPLVNYDVTTFDGTGFNIVDNPDASGANDTVTSVGEIVNSGATFEGIWFDLGEPLDLSEDKSFSMKFWSQTPIDVLVKLEQGTSDEVENSASHGGTGWELIYFTLDASAEYSRFTIFVDGPGTTSGTFYIDDIEQLNSDAVPCLETNLELPLDFDCESIDYASKIVGNVSFTVVDNPEPSGINGTNTKVGQITNVGTEFENAFFNLDTEIDFSADQGVRLKLFSNQALPILLKFEDDDSDDEVENSQMHGGTGWEELTFTLNSSASFNNMVLFVDGPGSAAGTFYVDDFEQVSVNVGPPCVPETMQSLNAVDFNLTFLNDPSTSINSDAAGFAWIDNPDFDNSINTSCKVGQIDRTSASMFANNSIELDAKLDFNDNDGFKLKVWSPTPETEVLLKLEDKTNSGIFKEVFATTSASSAMQWEELTFNFEPGDSNLYDKIVLFFELNTATQETYYIDDLRLFSEGGGTGDCPAPPAGEFIADGDFEANSECWVLFDNSGSATISSTVSNGGGTRSGEIQSASGANPGIKQERFGIGSVMPNTTYNVSFDIKASDTDPLIDGAILNAFMFSEPAEGSMDEVVQHVLVQGDGAVSQNWETRNFTFTTAGNVDGGGSILIELVCGGAATCSGTINIDNVSMTAQ